MQRTMVVSVDARGSHDRVCVATEDTFVGDFLVPSGYGRRLRALLEAGQACVDWARDTDNCHMCGRGMEESAGDAHDPECPLSEGQMGRAR